MQKRAVFLIGAGVKAGVENGAMLITYLFRYTSERTISLSNFHFLRLRRQGALTPLTKIPRTLLCPPSAQQQTRRPPLRLSIARIQTDGRSTVS